MSEQPQTSWWVDQSPPAEVVIYPRLHCPACQGTETQVTSTRKPIRYHRCLACGQRFKSVESPERAN